jgi:repressor LexA
MGKDADYLAKLQDYYAEHRVFPPYAAIGTLLGLKSKASVAALVGRLRSANILDATADRRLKPGPRFFERPLRESVRAGLPELAEENPGASISLDSYLIATPSRTVCIRVSGDSMTGAGIHAGDLAVVERTGEAKPGDLVVARVDGEFTLKRLEREDGGFVLRAANPVYADIRPRGQLEIFGLVTGIVRKY